MVRSHLHLSRVTALSGPGLWATHARCRNYPRRSSVGAETDGSSLLSFPDIENRLIIPPNARHPHPTIHHASFCTQVDSKKHRKTPAWNPTLRGAHTTVITVPPAKALRDCLCSECGASFLACWLLRPRSRASYFPQSGIPLVQPGLSSPIRSCFVVLPDIPETCEPEPQCRAVLRGPENPFATLNSAVCCGESRRLAADHQIFNQHGGCRRRRPKAGSQSRQG